MALIACGDDAAQPDDLCELGQDTYNEAVASFVSKSPSCTRDDECVRVQADVSCNGFSTSLCGVVVHRDLAPQWNDELVCGQLDAYPPAKYTCSVEASCIGGTPACESGRCTVQSRAPLDASAADAGHD